MDLTNQKFGEWTALYSTKKNKRIYWHCRCDCGVERDVLQYSLTSGVSSSCGHDTCKGKKYVDISNQIFGHLTVLEKTDKRDNGAVVWKCQCSCGNYVYWPADRLKQTKNPNCGCQKRENLIGQRFGKLTVLQEAPDSTPQCRKWQCQCECGNITYPHASDLKKGTVIGCGCTKSIGEYNIAKCLSDNNILFEKEYVFSDLIDKKHLRYDFAILNKNQEVIRLIEFDGEQHFKEDNRLYQNSSTKNHDILKNEYAKKNNIPLVRIPYWYRHKITLELLLTEDRFLQ